MTVKSVERFAPRFLEVNALSAARFSSLGHEANQTVMGCVCESNTRLHATTHAHLHFPIPLPLDGNRRLPLARSPDDWTSCRSLLVVAV